ncbi:MAG: hypothetical protein HOV83_13180 [Catenulispora sp.]|nr:hypothetical protein [Catenulispora sp.]
MTDMQPADELWSRLAELSDDELATLTAAAEHVLADFADAADEPETAQVAQLPRMPVAHVGPALAETLREAGTDVDPDDVTALLRDAEQARLLAIQALLEISTEPALAGEVAAAYRARREMMAVDPSLVLSGALLLFVLKLKRIKIGKVDISFYELRDGVLAQLRSLLGK